MAKTVYPLRRSSNITGRVGSVIANEHGALSTENGRAVGHVESALQRYGAVFNGTTNDTAALQETINWFAATHPRSVMRLPNMVNQRARLASTLFNDMAKVAIDFSQLELRPDAGVTALQLTGTDAAVHPQAAMFLQNFHIVGPGRAVAGTRGIFHHREDGVLMGPGASRYALRNFSISQCDIGEEYGNTAWGIGHYGWSIFEFNSAGIRVGSGYPDGYELPVYYGGALLNGINGIDLQRGQLTFVGSSLDYMRKFGTIQNGRVHLLVCHQETNQRRASYPANHIPWTISNNGAMLVKGGRLVMSDGNAGEMMLTHWVENNNSSPQSSGYALFDAVSMQNIVTSSGYLGRGTGAVIANNCVVEINGGGSATAIPIGVHESRNELLDGSFEAPTLPGGATSFLDTVYVRGGTVSSRHATNTVSIAVTDAGARTGTKCLRATKLAAAVDNTTNAGQADVYILKRVFGAARQYTGALRLRSPSATSQAIVQFGFFQGAMQTQGSDVVMVPAGVVQGQIDQSGTITLSNTWQQRRTSGSAVRAPAGYEWVGWRVRMNNMALDEVLDIDDVEIHAW